MTILDQARQLTAAGLADKAVALVLQAAENGDGEAAHMAAHWRLFGLYGARDLAQAHHWLDQAIASGHIEATRIKAALLANGTGALSNKAESRRLLRMIAARDQFAALQLAFSDRVVQQNARPFRLRTLMKSPLALVAEGLFTAEECRYLTVLASPKMQRSFVVHPVTGQRIADPVRTSTGTSFGPTEEDLVVRLLNERIARVTKTDVRCGEPLHILRYAVREEYRPHVDTFPNEPNQRDWTAIIYLNQSYAGGATHFPLAQLDVHGRQGDMLIFKNVDDEGSADPRTRHAGLPIEHGEKWIATRWIRRNPFHPWG